jgi:UDP-glucose 4-epimerase
MRWVHKGYPLPFASVQNARSLIALDNLVDLIMTCCVHPGAANQTFMAADEEDVSTAELVIRLGVALCRPARLFATPRNLLLALATIGGKRAQARKLLGDLRVDTRKTHELLDWRPAVTMERQLETTAKYFLEAQA